eukprot:3639652-Amphidinium_carterae.1
MSRHLVWGSALDRAGVPYTEWSRPAEESESESKPQARLDSTRVKAAMPSTAQARIERSSE